MLFANKGVSNFVNTKHILIMRTLPLGIKKSILAETCIECSVYVHVLPSEHIQEHTNFIDHSKTNVIR